MNQKTTPPSNIYYGSHGALSDARLAAIVESSFDAIVGKDLNGIITNWNPAAERLFGYRAEEAIRQPIYILIPEDRHHEEKHIIGRIRRGERVETFETVRRRKDGSLVPVSLTISPIRDAEGQIIGASKIARDISARKESERHIRFLLREINHRVKNQYAVILSMVRETMKGSTGSAELERKLHERIMSLASSHDLLVSDDWKGAKLENLVLRQLEPFAGWESITTSGPPLMVKPAAVQHLGMAFHELATNSAKYGVLAHGGTISVAWRVEETASGKAFHLSWLEDTSEPPLIDNGAERRGFGSVVLRRVTPEALSGSVRYKIEDGRVEWTLSAPLEAVIGTGGSEEEFSP